MEWIYIEMENNNNSKMYRDRAMALTVIIGQLMAVHCNIIEILSNIIQ